MTSGPVRAGEITARREAWSLESTGLAAYPVYSHRSRCLFLTRFLDRSLEVASTLAAMRKHVRHTILHPRSL